MTTRHVAWQALDGSSREHMTLRMDAEGISAVGVIAGELDDFSFGLRYRIELRADWRFKSLVIERTDGAALQLGLSPDGEWSGGDGRPMPELAGCIDIDLEGTPFSNTLPIRRVELDTGVPQRFRMAYIPFETLQPFADGQIYTALDAEGHYRYQAEDGTFEAELSVDGDGLVLRYPPLFERIKG